MTLKVENLVGGYSQVPVLKDVSFEVKSGHLLGLIGLNGAGKSTTIKHIIGLLRPKSGQILIDSVSLKMTLSNINKVWLISLKHRSYMKN